MTSRIYQVVVRAVADVTVTVVADTPKKAEKLAMERACATEPPDAIRVLKSIDAWRVKFVKVGEL